MNRSAVVQSVLWLERLAAVANGRAAKLREQLHADAVAELAEQGTASTWRVPAVAAVSLAVTHAKVYPSNPHQWLMWVAARYPDEVVRSVRASWQKAFLDNRVIVEHDADDLSLTVLVDASTGERIPGLGWYAGGEPGGVTIQATDQAKAAFTALATQALDRLEVEAGPSVPVELDVAP
jgi:hypothetical protein